LKKKSQDYIKRRSINFTNVRIAPKKMLVAEKEDAKAPPAPGSCARWPPGGANKKDRFYNIQNFSVTYAYNEEYKRDINIDWRLHKTYNGAFDYNFQNKPKEIKTI
jgi:hypothetical protein